MTTRTDTPLAHVLAELTGTPVAFALDQVSALRQTAPYASTPLDEPTLRAAAALLRASERSSFSLTAPWSYRPVPVSDSARLQARQCEPLPLTAGPGYDPAEPTAWPGQDHPDADAAWLLQLDRAGARNGFCLEDPYGMDESPTDAAREEFEADRDPLRYEQQLRQVLQDEPRDLHAWTELAGVHRLLAGDSFGDYRLSNPATASMRRYHRQQEARVIECAVAIGQLSLPPGFSGVLEWGVVDNRPFLRLLHTHLLNTYAAGELHEALLQAENLIMLCPRDNLGIRHLIHDLLLGLPLDKGRVQEQRWESRRHTKHRAMRDAVDALRQAATAHGTDSAQYRTAKAEALRAGKAHARSEDQFWAHYGRGMYHPDGRAYAAYTTRRTAKNAQSPFVSMQIKKAEDR